MDTSDLGVQWLRAKSLQGNEQIQIMSEGVQEKNKWNKTKFNFDVLYCGEVNKISLSVPHITQLKQILSEKETKRWIGKIVNVTAVPMQIEGKQQLTFEFSSVEEKIGR